MAITNTRDAFNPDVQDVSPGNPFLSKPIDSFSYKSATGEALKGTGDVLEAVVKGTDEVVKASARKDVREKIEPEQDALTAALVGADRYMKYAALGGNTAVDATSTIPRGGSPEGLPNQAGVDPISLIPNDADIPQDIKQLPNQIMTLRGARDSGKISQTDYYGRVASLAKDIRSNYPVGYRDYIDTEVSKITGVDPANAYIHGMIAHINENLTSSKQEAEHAAAFLRANPMPGWETKMEQLKSGQASPVDIYKWMGPNMTSKWQHEQKMANFTESEAGNKFITSNAKLATQQFSADTVYSMIHSVEGIPGFMGPQDLDRIVTDHLTGKSKLDSTQATYLGNAAEAWIQQASAKIEAEGYKDRGGKSLAGVLGPEAFNKEKEAALAPLRRIRQAFVTGDISIAADTANLVKAASNDTTYKLLQQKDVGNHLLMIDTLRKFGGDQAVASFLARANITKLSNEWSKLSENTALQLMTPDDPRVFKDYGSFKDAYKKISDLQKANGVDLPKSYEAVFNLVTDQFLNQGQSPEVKGKIAKSLFGPENMGFLRTLAPDTVDSKGNVIKGYQSVYYQLTQPEFVTEIKKLGEPYISMYNNWTKTAVSQDLFKQDISKINEMQLDGGGVWRVKYTNEGVYPKFVIENTGTPEQIRDYQLQQRTSGRNVSDLQQTLNSINKGLAGQSNIARHLEGLTGESAEAYAIESLVDAGLSPGRVGDIPGLPPMLADSLKAAHTKTKFDQETQEMRRQDRTKQRKRTY